MDKKIKRRIRSFLLIAAGTGIMAFAIKSAYDSIGLVTGGFTGIGIMVRRLTTDLVDGGIPIWITNLVLDIPLLLVALKLKGRRFLGWTLVATLLLSFWLGVIPQYDLSGGDFLLAAVYGGVLMGTGVGLGIERAGGYRRHRSDRDAAAYEAAVVFHRADLTGY